ncbi:acetoacetyl-CoA reductase [Roseovarius salinarum]|uniref:acetoacetyl-CoA reductase n=1 Tax=Roseovarius salinarum TaxID=1981892 RepID=UPI000C33CD70|nr:acetoacetyl-CoA reductase [Roseovarius salinarum]
MTDTERVALVTGGIQGLGAAAAKALEDAGFRVAVTHLGGGARADRFARDTGLPVFEWDVANRAACRDGIARIEDRLGPIDVLVNNAGVNRDVMFHEMEDADWDAVIDVDLGGVFNMTRPVMPGMRARGYGRIINISSVNAARGQAGQTNYCAAKAGVEGFTRALARESAGKGITVNAIAPGYADTDMVAQVPDEIMDRIIGQVPMGRLADPGEVGRCVRFLASEDAAFITGATLPVNGGLRMG